MKRFALLAVISSACTLPVGGGAVSTTAETASVAASAPTTSTSTRATATTTTSRHALPALAIHTTTGVPVAVLSDTGTGYVVRTTCGQIDYVMSGDPIVEAAVVLDPGHGGPLDTGASGRDGLMEKDVNLEVARTTQVELQARGFSVVLTRTGDYAVPLSNRAAFADHLGAELMVSIHHNAPTPGESRTPGTEIFAQTGSSDSRRLGGLVWEHLIGALSVFEVRWAASPDAGVLTVLNARGVDAYGMIREPDTVTVLTELLYISSPQEAALMVTNAYIAAASTALADAIEAYLVTDAIGSGHVDEPRVFNPQPRMSPHLCVEAVLE